MSAEPVTEATKTVLVTVDSLRADAVEHDPESEVTPVLGELSSRSTSTVFENAFAHGNWTPFSFPSILASRSVFSDSRNIGAPETPTLAEALSREGISTGGFNASNGFLTHHWEYDRGFDEFEDFIEANDTVYSKYLMAHPTVQGWIQLGTSPFKRLASAVKREGDDTHFADTSRMIELENRAEEFIRERSDESFFVWIHYMDTHTPYVPAPRHVREVSSSHMGTVGMLRAHLYTGLGWDVDEKMLSRLRTLYDATVRQVDESIGRLLSLLSDEGIRDETCVVVAGDHGEEFQEHGHLAHYPKLYNELINVPLMVDLPKDGLEADSVSEPVGLNSVPPTVCDVMGVTPPEGWEGESLLRDGPDDEPVVSVTVRGDSVTQQPIPKTPDEGDLLVSARTSDWTYIQNAETGEKELYNTAEDDFEKNDLYSESNPEFGDTEIIESFRRRVHERAEEVLSNESHEEEEMSDEVSKRLEALGYR